MPRQLPLFLLRKSRFKSFKALRVFLTDKISHWVFVGAGDTVQKTGRQLLDEKIIRFRVVGIADTLYFGRHKAGLAVKVNIAGDGKCSCTHFLGFFHGIVQQLLSVALPLVCGRNADGAEGHDRHLSSVIAVDFRPHIDTFDGWYDENGAQYTENTVYAIAGDATLTARWTANIYEITLDANGGVTDVALVQVTFGQAVGALPTPTREGYVFLGWFDEVGSRYDASTVYSTADGVTLTARWGQEDSTFTITLNANGGKVEPSALAVVYGQAVGTLPVPTREGYTFGGWYDKDGNRYDASSVYSVKGDTTLTARWIENSVQTGDGFPIFLLSGAMMAAAAGAVMLLLKRRKLMGE